MQNYFHSCLCSYLPRVPILVEDTVYIFFYVYFFFIVNVNCFSTIINIIVFIFFVTIIVLFFNCIFIIYAVVFRIVFLLL